MTELQRREFIQKSAGAIVAGAAAATVAGTAVAAQEGAAMASEVWQIDDLIQQRKDRGGPYLQFMKVSTMHMGVYSLAAQANDPQPPHNEDEAYYVLKGKAKIKVDDKEYDVKAGSVIFVKAKAVHKFHSIEEDLDLLVFFTSAPIS